jgi:hypothetical protein
MIWHELLKESYWLRFLRHELVKRNVVSLFVIDMACSQYCLHQPPVPAGLVDILQVEDMQGAQMKLCCQDPEKRTKLEGEISKHLAPVLFNGVVGSAKVVTWNSRRNMVRDMYIYVMAKDLYPVNVQIC